MSNLWPGLWPRWQTLFKLRQRDTWCQIPKRISSYSTYSERADPWLHVLVCAFFSTSPLSTWQTPTPRPPSLFQTPFPCECFSPLSILSAPGNSGHCATRPRFQIFPIMDCASSSFWSLTISWGQFPSAIVIQISAWPILSKCSQLFVVEWSKGIYV